MIDKMPLAEELKSASILKNERFAFQIAYQIVSGISYRHYPISFEIKSPLKDYITVRKVEHMPAELLTYHHPWTKDDTIISDKPGFYPDLLTPLSGNKFYVVQSFNDSLWFTLDTDGKVDAGVYDIVVELTYKKKAEKEGEEDLIYSVTKTVQLEIIDAYLPEQKLMYTQWFHADCLSAYYKVETFSEKHWEIIEKFMRV